MYKREVCLPFLYTQPIVNSKRMSYWPHDVSVKVKFICLCDIEITNVKQCNAVIGSNAVIGIPIISQVGSVLQEPSVWHVTKVDPFNEYPVLQLSMATSP